MFYKWVAFVLDRRNTSVYNIHADMVETVFFFYIIIIKSDAWEFIKYNVIVFIALYVFDSVQVLRVVVEKSDGQRDLAIHLRGINSYIYR